MPKNPSIALNLLQSIAIVAKERDIPENSQAAIKACIATIENSSLTEEQEERYNKVRGFLEQSMQ
jgi:hypothetical protein